MSGAYAKARRVKRSPAARVRPFWILIAFAAAVVAGAAAFAALWPGFFPKSVAVYGNHRVPTAEVLHQARIASNRSLWLQNTDAAAARIRAIPYVDSVWIHRIPPSSVRIVVRERTPFAILDAGGQSVVVDAALRVLDDASGEEPLPVLSLPAVTAPAAGGFVTTADARGLRDAYETLAAGGLAPARLELDGYGELTATLHGGLRLLLGDPEDLHQRIALANAIVAQVRKQPRHVATIDLRAPSAPVIVY